MSAERRTALLAEFERSGMTVAEFSRWSGVRQATLYGWKRRLRVRSLPGPSETAAAASGEVAKVKTEPVAFPWVEAVVAPEAGMASVQPARPALALPLVVTNRNGVRLEIHSGEHAVWAGQLLARLEGARSC